MPKVKSPALPPLIHDFDRVHVWNGHWSFLTNFATSPVVIPADPADDLAFFDGVFQHEPTRELYGTVTVEHGFAAMKTVDPAERLRIAAAKTPGEAKLLGRQTKLRRDWELVKNRAMWQLLLQKYRDDPLRERLRATGDARLVEVTYWHDNVWGDCQCGHDACRGVVGENRLGRMLELVRGQIQLEVL